MLNVRVFGQNMTTTPFTFSEAYAQMNQNSHVLKQAGFEIREKEADKKAATAG